MRNLFLSFLFLFLAPALLHPASVFAASTESCEETVMSCECIDENGDTILSTDESIANGDACAADCANRSSTSYVFICGDSQVPTDSGDISDYLDSLADKVGIPTVTKEDPAIPALNVPIPGLDLAGSVETDAQGNITTNMIGLYVNAVFSYGIVIAALLGVLMLTVAGFQYMTAGGDKGAVTKAKDRMQSVVFGLIILMATYCIAFLIDPRTTYFNALTLKNVAEISLNDGSSGNEGSGISGGTGTWGNLGEPYRTIVSDAKTAVTCEIPDLISSPTGKLPNQGNHHWYDRGLNGDYKSIAAMDWAASWNSEIYAPFEGTVSYQQQTDTSNSCGNRIYLRSADGTATITICHAKDFTDDAGDFSKTRSVEKGDVLGHVGGVCCAGQDDAYDVTKCDVSGTMCTDPTKAQNCSCQRVTEAGNTTGPHVHLTYNNMPSGMLLACLE